MSAPAAPALEAAGLAAPVRPAAAIAATIAQRIAAEIAAQPAQVKAAVELLDEGETVPFIARYC